MHVSVAGWGQVSYESNIYPQPDALLCTCAWLGGVRLAIYESNMYPQPDALLYTCAWLGGVRVFSILRLSRVLALQV